MDFIFTKPITKALLTFIITNLSFSLISWALVNIYTLLCAEFTLKGAILSIFFIGSPTCMAINFIQYEFAKHYALLLATAAASFVGWALH